jgi:hypothetical protein
MFDFVERCDAHVHDTGGDLAALYDELEHGVRDNLFDSRDACLAHYRDPANLERYAREEYKNSLGTLKAIALLDHIEPVLAIAGTALRECIAAAGLETPSLRDYVHDLIEYSRLRRRSILDSSVETEGTFRFAFDRIHEQGFRVAPEAFRLERERRMRFWHDADQTRDIQRLCAEIANPVYRARSFIYPTTDPGVNPYLRRSAFC